MSQATTFQWVPLSTGAVLAPDGSGATALVSCQGWSYSCDILGDVKCRLLTETSSRIPPRWMAEHVRATYRAELSKLATPEWLELNRAMYAAPADYESENH